MPWAIPDYIKPVDWKDAPTRTSALSADNLNLVETGIADYVVACVDAYSSFAEGRFLHADDSEWSGNHNLTYPYGAMSSPWFQSTGDIPPDPATRLNGRALSPIRPVGFASASVFNTDATGTTWQSIISIDTGNQARQAVALGTMAVGNHVWAHNPNAYTDHAGGVSYSSEADGGYTGGGGSASANGYLISGTYGAGSTLSVGITSGGGAITTLTVNPVPFTPADLKTLGGDTSEYPKTGDTIILNAVGKNGQNVVLSADVHQADTVLHVNSFTPNDNYAIGTGVRFGRNTGDGERMSAEINSFRTHGWSLKSDKGCPIDPVSGNGWMSDSGVSGNNGMSLDGIWSNAGYLLKGSFKYGHDYSGSFTTAIRFSGTYATSAIDYTAVSLGAKAFKLGDGNDLSFGTATGGHVGATSADLIGHWGSTPRVQPVIPAFSFPSNGAVSKLLDALNSTTGSGLVDSTAAVTFSQTTPVTSNNTIPLPPGTYEIDMIAGGGGGGNGGVATTGIAQVGGGGGGAGEHSKAIYTNAGPGNANAVVTVGASGIAGVLSGNVPGGMGGDTTVVIGGVTYTARGGGHGQNGGANSTTAVGGGTYAGSTGSLVASGTLGTPPAGGGGGHTTNTSSDPGGHIGLSGSGGQGGAAATPGGLGGNGGASGVAAGIASPGVVSGNTVTTSGANGTDAANNSGAGGGGGGAAATGGTQGLGGKGGTGCVWFKLIHA